MKMNDLPILENENKCEANSYFAVLEVLSQSTDDFLFYYDIINDRIHFFGSVNERYAIGESDKGFNTLDELIAIVHPADKVALKNDLDSVFSGKSDVHNIEYRWESKSGEYVWLSCRGKIVKDGDHITAMVGRVSEEALRHLYNPVTGIFNQHRLIPDLKKYLASGEYTYLMLVDVDDLSAINLSHGRAYGDELLKSLANEIESIESAGAVYHAERNFFALCLNVPSTAEARNIYKKLCTALNDKCTLTSGIVPIDSSVFVDENSLFDSAKVVLRKAKLKGKQNIEFFSVDEMKKKISSVELLEELTESVNKDFSGFFLTFQPQLQAGNYNISCAEALIRYTSKAGKLIYPNDFIPLLEQSKLIIPVGMWVLKNALLQCKEWRKSCADMRISVNFSVVQLKDEYIVDKVMDVLKETDMPGSALTMEITESIPAVDLEYIRDIIFNLKSVGIQIAIDDFGTGYSNLAYLKNLDIDEIKIDRVFVKDIEEDTYNFRIVSNTVDFAKLNSIRICCEGVETPRELAILESRSPDLFQGYLFDKPCSANEITQTYILNNSESFKKRNDFLQELYKYKENFGAVNFDPRDILRETDVGLWLLRVSHTDGHGELYVDETMERLMSIDKNYTARERYDYWYSRVVKDYANYVKENFEHMEATNKVVQLQYKWNHPELGEVAVRSSGRYVKDADGFAVLEGYHKIMENIEQV